MTWLPVVAFIFLGAVFLDKSLRRNAKRTWAWGRMGEGAPLSRTSYAIWGPYLEELLAESEPKD